MSNKINLLLFFIGFYRPRNDTGPCGGPPFDLYPPSFVSNMLISIYGLVNHGLTIPVLCYSCRTAGRYTKYAQ